MEVFQFKKATKKKAKLRLALCGPSGSGKTYSALAIGTALADGQGVLVLDTERGSAAKYADGHPFDFDTFEDWDRIGGYDPERLIEMLQQAANSYSVVIVDSLSHFWFGTGGELDKVDRAAKRTSSNNSFAAWKEVTPIHNRLVNTLLSVPTHIICTMRTKTEWVLEENDKGRKVPRKIGTTPIMRDGIEFEFDLCGDMDQNNTLVVTKSRCPELTGAVIERPGKQMAEDLRQWLNKGVDGEEIRSAPLDAEPVPPVQGSREAAQEVAQRKIAELQGKRVPSASESGRRKVNGEQIDFLNHFATIKLELHGLCGSDAEYYGVLNNFGYEKSSSIPNKQEAKPVYKALCERRNELLLAAQDAKAYVATDEDLPAEVRP